MTSLLIDLCYQSNLVTFLFVICLVDINGINPEV
jgi:hypothetical protein